MPVDVKYRTTASALGGRDGQARTEDGSFAVKLSTPKELGVQAATAPIPSSYSPLVTRHALSVRSKRPASSSS
jgi:hypothetical protein